MFSFTIATDIGAPPARVWRALCDPNEVVRWDTGVCEALDAPSDYPRPGQHVRWRLRGNPSGVLHDCPLDVVPPARLRAALSFGRIRIDETYTLRPAPSGSRLHVDLCVVVQVPVLGGLLARFRAGPRLRSAVADSMAALKRHCELHP